MFKAIFTRYIGPTNFRGSRIKAHDQDGNQVTISYPDELDSDDAHALAARKLLEKMNWKGTYYAGGTKEGRVFVCVSDEKITR